MKKNQIIALIALAALAVLAVLFAMSAKEPPALPANNTHAVWNGPERCHVCHGPGAAQAKPKNHPIGNDCLRCHDHR